MGKLNGKKMKEGKSGFSIDNLLRVVHMMPPVTGHGPKEDNALSDFSVDESRNGVCQGSGGTPILRMKFPKFDQSEIRDERLADASAAKFRDSIAGIR